MLRCVLIWISLVSLEASRIQVHEVSQSQFGASCETLQNRFHDRVAAMRTSLDGTDQEAGMSSLSQVRFALRMNGIIRVMRRARECSWVVDNNTDDFHDLQVIVQNLLANNPCADAAMAEMQTGVAAGTEAAQAATLPTVLSILVSDDCVASEPEAHPQAIEDPEAQMQQDEDEVQDGLEDLLDRAGVDNSAFVQMDQSTIRRFFKVIGVIFLSLLLILGCVYGTAYIMIFLGAAVGYLGWRLGLIDYRGSYLGYLETGIIAGYVSFFASILPCLAVTLSRVTVPMITNSTS